MAREMKDSGIQWVGAIPTDWNCRRLRFLCKIQTGNQDTQDSVADGVYPFYVRSPIVERSNKFTFEGPAILMAGDGAGAGRIFHYVDGKYGCHQRVYSLQAITEINRRFLYYYLSNLFYREIEVANSKSTVDSVRLPMLQNFQVVFPDGHEQGEIVRYLDSKCAEIDAVLDKTRTSIEEYKKLKQAIITQAVTKGIRGDRSMKGSGIEWIGSCPTNWTIIRIKWLLEEGKDRSTEGTEEPLSMSQKYGILPTKEMDIVPNMASSFVGAKLVRKGDLVFNKLKAHLGVFAVSDYDGLVSPDYAVYRTTSLANAKFLEYLFKTSQYISEFKKKSTGIAAGLTRLYTEGLYSIFCALPPIEEQQEIVSYLQGETVAIDTLIQKKEQFLAELETYKKSLIYEYVTGKKEVCTEQQTEIIVVYPYFPATIKASKPRFAQAVLMSKVLDECRTKMGRVKLEKMMFVLENSIGFDFDTEYMREAAGPLDKSIYECEQIISRRNKWFTIRKSQYGVSYKPTSEHSKYKKYYAQYFSDYEDAINKVISIFNDFDADQAEVIATLYGAWNDCIIDKRSYTDNDIVDEVLNHWHPKKRRFPKDMWLRAIQRMRELDLVPHGYGRHTIIKQN